MTKPYYVYVLKCADDTLYTGIAIDVARRVIEHNESKIGAKYTKARRPVILVHQEKLQNRSQALKREYEIKQMPREEKMSLFSKL